MASGGVNGAMEGEVVGPQHTLSDDMLYKLSKKIAQLTKVVMVMARAVMKVHMVSMTG